MTIHCDNCGQAILSDDTNCWHCGTKLAPQKNVTEGVTTGGREPTKWVLQTTANSMALDTLASPTAVYGIITAVVIMMAFILLGRLSQPPLLQIASSNIPPNGWSRITYGDYEFTITIPPSWQISQADRMEEAGLAETVKNIPFYEKEVLLPYQTLADDFEVLLLASNGDPAADGSFVIIAKSQTLSNLSHEQAEQLSSEMAAELSYDLFKQEIMDNANKSHFSSGTFTEHLRCQQQFTNGRIASMVIAACATHGEYTQQRETLEKILSSFEYLKRSE